MREVAGSLFQNAEKGGCGQGVCVATPRSDQTVKTVKAANGCCYACFSRAVVCCDWGWEELKGKELGPWRFRPFHPNQNSELNLLIFPGKPAQIEKKEGFTRTPPNRYGPSSSLSIRTSKSVKILKTRQNRQALHTP